MPNGTERPSPGRAPTRGPSGPGVRPTAGAGPSPLDLAGRLAADQARQRLAQGEAGTEPARGTPTRGAGPVLLELPTRSYTMPEETEAERERKRQLEMQRTMERFLYPEEVVREEVPPEARRPPPEVPPEEEEVAPPEVPPIEPDVLAREQAEAARLLEAQQRAMMDQAMAEDILARGQLLLRQQRRGLVQANKRTRQLMKLLQGFGSIKLVPLLTLILQMNFETINKWFFKKDLPPLILVDDNPKLDADDVTTGCVDGLVCSACAYLCFFYVFPFALIAAIAAAAQTDLWGTIGQFAKQLFSRG